MKIHEIVNAISLISDKEELARVAGEALRQVAKLGRSAWEELFQMIDSLEEDEQGEIREFLSEYTEVETNDDQVDDLINQDQEES